MAGPRLRMEVHPIRRHDAMESLPAFMDRLESYADANSAVRGGAVLLRAAVADNLLSIGNELRKGVASVQEHNHEHDKRRQGELCID